MNIGKSIRFLRKEKGWTQQSADFTCANMSCTYSIDR